MGRAIWLSTVLAGLFAATAAGQVESGAPLIRSFSPKAYRASPQNWAAVQDRGGVLYVANTNCVLEYDGVSWRRIAVGHDVGALSLAVGADNRIFVGAQGDFGYLDSDAASSMKFRSLSSLVAAGTKFSDVWSVFSRPSGTYFGSFQAIFRWHNNTLKVWKPKRRFGRLAQAGDSLYVTSEGEGLLRLDAQEFVPVPGGKDLKPSDVRTLISDPRGLLVITRKALFRLQGGELTPVKGDFEDKIGAGTILSAARLGDGSIGLATSLSGVLFIRSDGSLVRTLAKDNGLLANMATSLFEDREGGLWITSAGGLDRADMAMTRFGQSEGLFGATYVLIRHGGELYAGTDQGMFALRQDGFVPVKGISEAVFGGISTPRGLVVGGQLGIYAVNGTSSSVIRQPALAYDTAVSLRDPNLLYTASREGLDSFRWDGSKWTPDRHYPSGGEDFRSVMEDADGRIWVATAKDILRVDWRKAEATVERFGATSGVPAGFKNVYRIRGTIVFATPKGLLKFDPSFPGFLPWDQLGKEFADGSRPVSAVREVADGRIWITGEGYHGELRPKAGGGWEWRSMPLGRAEMAELYAMLPEADGTVWAAGTDGFLVRYSPRNQPPPAPFGVLVRRVLSQGGPTAYEGAGVPGEPPRIRYGNNSLRFEFAAPYMQDPLKVEYRVRLDGADSDWSTWSTETTKDYTHLWEGAYKMLVQARNPAGVMSRETAFAFAIAAPWFRTWPAYVFYVFAAIGSVWGLLKWRVSKLEEEKANLEQVVVERTVEIRQQRDQIQVEQEKSQNLLLNILPASVAEELKNTGTVEPQNYDEVTVCFTDFVGFTLSSEALPASHLVSALHEYFTTFDEIVDEFGLEKLKTIGDAYMLVSGLPRPRRAHAVDAVLAALRMAEAVEELSKRGDGPVWGVRVGLHSGAVAAGVVGVRKFAFDIWGNTVNLASRMESSGKPGRVNLSQDTWELVEEFIECEERGAVQTKDKRDLRMYFAVGVRPELSEPGVFAARYRQRFGEEPSFQIPVAQKVVI